MQMMKYFSIFSLAILVIAQPTIGQYAATPIKADLYYFISNKALNNDQGITYSKDVKNFPITENAHYNWKFVRSTGGRWEFVTGADPNDKTKGQYVWKENGAANQYSLQMLINGKFWALSSTDQAQPILAEVSAQDVFQKWEVEAQPDGFYKITNIGLKNNNYQNRNLFADIKTKSLFIAKWEEASSLNGRWHLIMAGTINQNDGKDLFDSRRMILSPLSMNANVCLKDYMPDDSRIVYLITPCENTAPDRFTFQKTITGAYLIKVEINQSGRINSYYLDNQLELKTPYEIDILNPDLNHTWNINNIGNGLFMIVASATQMVFEMVKGYTRTSGPGGWGYSKPDHVQLKRWEGKYEQQWFLKD